MLVVKGKYGWSTPCSSKDMGNNELSCWMSVQFKRGNEPTQEKLNIDVKQFFMSCFNSKDGIKPKMVVMEWGYAQKVEKDNNGNKYVANDGFSNTPSIDIDTDSLPFY